VERIAEPAKQQPWMENIPVILVGDLFFWCAAIVVVALSFWSLLAACVLFAGAAVVWFERGRRNATYRCDGCNAVLTFEEVKRGKSRAV
jgi:hypothetical protein